MGIHHLARTDFRANPWTWTARVRSSDLVRRLRRHEAGTHLIRRFRRAEALTIEPRPIEAANASLPSSEHFAGIVDPTRASLSTGLFLVSKCCVRFETLFAILAPSSICHRKAAGGFIRSTPTRNRSIHHTSFLGWHRSKATYEDAEGDSGENMLRYPKGTAGTELCIQDFSCPGRHRQTLTYIFQHGGGQRVDSHDEDKERP